ncbi:MAG: dienelactone hydrolase family protein [Actinomycetes bacterium]
MSLVDLPPDPEGATARGHLALPPGGTGPGVIVVQEWWGLNPGIVEMADRLAAAGFVALAPDLYRGELAGHDEIDKAAALMQALPLERAAADMSRAVDYLASHPAATGAGIGVVGFCMGGMLALVLAATRGDVVKAAVPFYGVPTGEAEPDWAGLTAVVRGHLADHDDFFPPEVAKELEARLRDGGHDVEFVIHPGTGHAFMGPHDTFGTLDLELSARLWPEVCAFLHDQLG